MPSLQQQQTTTEDAVKAMRARGVIRPERYAEHASPERIVGACLQWDLDPRAGVGVLVNLVKAGGMDPPRQAERTPRRILAPKPWRYEYAQERLW